MVIMGWGAYVCMHACMYGPSTCSDRTGRDRTTGRGRRTDDLVAVAGTEARARHGGPTGPTPPVAHLCGAHTHVRFLHASTMRGVGVCLPHTKRLARPSSLSHHHFITPLPH